MASENSTSSLHANPGDKAAFEALFTAHYVPLCRYAHKFTGDMERARDLVQDVFVSFYDKASAVQISQKAYLYRSVHNACLNYIRQSRTRADHHENIKLRTPALDERDVLISQEMETRIWAVIENLPEQCRRIFKMNRLEGKKNAEIAEALNISIRTVETQISKALRSLRENLGDLLLTLFLALFSA